MHAGLPVGAMAGSDSQDFEQLVISYAQQLSLLLTENPWAFWTKAFWAYGHWARRDSELRKILARIYGLLDEIQRLYRTTDGITETDRRRIQQLVAIAPATLTLDAALEVFDGLDRIVIEIGDARYICDAIEREHLWSQGSTTWLTWDRMYGASIPEAVETFTLGLPVPAPQLDAARNRLLSFRRARSDDYRVHRARQKMRARNLSILAALLLPLVIAFCWLLAAIEIRGVSGWGVGLVAVVGALGSVMSGTIRARDRLVRGSDLRAFRSGLLAQVLIGAGSSLVIFLVLASGMLDIAGTDSLVGKAAVGFAAGFSEPLFLKTVERVAKMGEESAGS